MWPEMAVHPLDQHLAQTAGEIEVDVRQAGHVLGDEALQRQVPLERVDVADADQVADQQGHGGAAPAAGVLSSSGVSGGVRARSCMTRWAMRTISRYSSRKPAK